MSQPQSYDPYSTAAVPGAAAPSDNDRNFALAAHLGAPFTAWFALGLIAPLIVLVVRGQQSPFVRGHAVESLNFNINAAAWGVVGGVLSFITFGLFLPVLIAYGVFYVVATILGSVRASQGRTFRYPFTVRLVS